jgi:hypothetical protein
MIFRSTLSERTWDTCVYFHEGTYYLYYLITEKTAGDGFGIATSTDGVHWKDHGLALSASEQMVRYMGSGSIWKEPAFEQTHRFITNYSEWRMEGDKQIQNLFFAWSTDLLHWTKYGEEYIFKIDEQYYEKSIEHPRGIWENPRWDTIFPVPRPTGGYYGYWTATPKGRLGFGFGESQDGIHWKALPPPEIKWEGDPSMIFIEVGAVQQIGKHYFAMLADYAGNHCGVYAFTADQPGGPFRPCRRNFNLIRNQSKMHAYFARFVANPSGLLANHHSIACGDVSIGTAEVFLAPLKKVQAIGEALYLKWWEGNDALKVSSMEIMTGENQLVADPDRGILLEGRLGPQGSLFLEEENGQGTRLQVQADGIVKIGNDCREGSRFEPRETIDRQLDLGPERRFRLLLRSTMLEFYLNDYLIQCYTMNKPASGFVDLQGIAKPRLWSWEK